MNRPTDAAVLIDPGIPATDVVFGDQLPDVFVVPGNPQLVRRVAVALQHGRPLLAAHFRDLCCEAKSLGPLPGCSPENEY